MNTEGSTEAPKPTWKAVISQIWKPTNAGGKLMRGSVIAVSVLILYFKVLKPTVMEMRFRSAEEFANRVYDMEQKQKNEEI